MNLSGQEPITEWINDITTERHLFFLLADGIRGCTCERVYKTGNIMRKAIQNAKKLKHKVRSRISHIE